MYMGKNGARAWLQRWVKFLQAKTGGRASSHRETPAALSEDLPTGIFLLG